ncbi:Dilute class unconventional myosin, partial [Operophtera brumata]
MRVRAYQRLRKLAIGLQAHCRGFLARRLYSDRMRVRAVICSRSWKRLRIRPEKLKLDVLKALETEAKALRTDQNEKDSLINALQSELAKERDANWKLLEEKKEIANQYKKDRETWEGEKRDKQHEQEKKALSAELEAERQSRQKLLSSQYELQERLDSMQRMQNRLSALQGELSRTSKRDNDLEDRLMTRMSSPPTNANVDRFKVEELEMENKKLREHLDRLRAAGDSVLVSKEVL